MQLYKYLELTDLTIKQFATILDIDRSYLNLIILGHRIPSKKLALRIEKATKGKIKAIDLIFPEESN